MTAATTLQISYDRQISSESGWENPFRPGGDLSREADEIVNMIKGGKPITPTGENCQVITNGFPTSNNIENGVKEVKEVAIKQDVSQNQSTQNGTKTTPKNIDKKDESTKSASQTQISKQIVPGPASASHVVIENKKKKKCTCCVIQ